MTSKSITDEPPHDKINKMTVRSAKTQTSLGIHPSRGIKLVDAVTRGDMKVIDDLLSKDVDLDVEIKGDNAIHMAARTGRLGVIKRLKRKGDNLEKGNINGNTPAHYAARDGYTGIIEYLSLNNVNMNAVNNEGNTPLHLSVAVQTMDIIEDLIVKWGMDPNFRNKDGQTPLHIAVLYNRQETMEALVLCGASPDIRDNNNKRAEDIAKHRNIRDTLKIYTAMKVAMGKGCIQAKGLKITTALVSRPLTIDRVGIILESIAIPTLFPTAFYCRREKSENTSVLFKPVEDEKFFSDIFHIKVSDVNRDCTAKINLPLYVAPSEKDEMVLRFMNCADEDHVASECVIREGVPYCMLETVLVPESTCICVVKVRPKKENISLNTEAQTVTSDIDTSFTLEIPSGTFEENTVLSLQVYGTGQDAEVFDSDEELDDDNDNDNTGKIKTTENNIEALQTAREGSAVNLAESPIESDDTESPIDQEDINNTDNTDSGSCDNEFEERAENKTEEMTDSDLLITDMYQVNVLGDQPTKNVTMQIPLRGHENVEDLAIVCADERLLHKDGSLEILQKEPTIVNGSLIFEVSHFCLYFGTFRNLTLKKEDKVKLQRQISMCKEQRQMVVFFAMVKKDAGSMYRHSVVVECCRASKFVKRRKKWLKKGYKYHEVKETCERDIVADDEFYVDIEGCTELSGDKHAVDRKLKYSAVRSSYKYYEVSLKSGAKDGSAIVSILEKSFSTGFDTVVELPIVLELPPPPPPTPTSRSRPSTAREHARYEAKREEIMKVYPSCAQS